MVRDAPAFRPLKRDNTTRARVGELDVKPRHWIMLAVGLAILAAYALS